MERRDFLRLVGGASLLAACPVIGAVTGKGRTVKLDKLTMQGFNTTMMGVVKGALDYHQINFSAPMVFGGSGHAFLINIHKELCPSGPYCWKRTAVDPLIRNLGLEMTDLGFFSPKSAAEDRATVERKLCSALDQGIPCSLINMENQLILGCDDSGFITAQPWGDKCGGFPPARLTFGSWKELGDSFHMNFYTLQKVKPADERQLVLDSLDYAVDLHTHPAKHGSKDYGVGPDAYANWIGAVEKSGASHGNWWNGMVWSECRKMAAKYFAEIGQHFSSVTQAASDLSQLYTDIGDTLGRISDKKMPADEKITLLGTTRDKEASAIKQVAALAAMIRPGTRESV